MMKENSVSSEMALGLKEIRFSADGFGDHVWECWLSPPLCNGNELAEWLTQKDRADNLLRRGVYVWLAPRNADKGLQVLHVGVSYRESSSVLKRTRDHLSDHFKWKKDGADTELRRINPIPTLKPRESFTAWNEIVRANGNWANYHPTDEEIYAFLRRVRVLYLTPGEEVLESGPPEEVLLNLEGAIARTSEHFLGRGQTTNTIRGAVAPCSDTRFESIKADLNRIVPGGILPNEPFAE